MGRPGQDDKTLERAIKLYNEHETNGMSVNQIVKSTGIPRSTLYAKVKEVI
jgi:AcrR family transcriptional regulator